MTVKCYVGGCAGNGGIGGLVRYFTLRVYFTMGAIGALCSATSVRAKSYALNFYRGLVLGKFGGLIAALFNRGGVIFSFLVTSQVRMLGEAVLGLIFCNFGARPVDGQDGRLRVFG